MVCAVGEGYDSSNATAIMPTRSRHNGETIVKITTGFAGTGTELAVDRKTRMFFSRCHDAQCTPPAKRPKRLCYKQYSTFCCGRGRHHGDIFLNDF